jgi:gamma-D-glutamyl-L-lysine dipeptidyl-peptidase
MNTRNFGICRLSIVPVRAAAGHKQEQVTQLLFGDHYEVTAFSADRKWLSVRIFADGYEGWIDSAQHTEISEEFFEYINRAELKITTDLTSSLLYNKSPLVIPIGSVIPISGSELFRMEEQFAFNGEAKSLGLKRDFEYLKGIALKYLNAPYLWGGKGPFGIDCSGFVQMVFRICGFRLLRDSSQQANQGKLIKSFGEIKAGDLLFFKDTEGRIVHVGIYFGDHKIIHASGRVRIDTVTEAGIHQPETKIITHTFSHIRRMLPDQ